MRLLPDSPFGQDSSLGAAYLSAGPFKFHLGPQIGTRKRGF